MRIVVLAIATLVVAAVTPLSGAGAEPAKRPTVVEVYTSQGCNSCVPVEALLETLTRRPDVLALSFHVDCWDFLGWRDPYGSREHAVRQQQYVRRTGVSYVYTPQLVVDGLRQATSLDAAAVARLIDLAAAVPAVAPDVHLFLHDRDHMGVAIGAADWRGDADVPLVRFDREQSTDIRAGVNAGRTVTGRNIVRALMPLGTLNVKALELRLPMMPRHDIRHELCAVIMQERPQGRILGVGVIDRPAALAALK